MILLLTVISIRASTAMWPDPGGDAVLAGCDIATLFGYGIDYQAADGVRLTRGRGSVEAFRYRGTSTAPRLTEISTRRLP